MRRAIQEAVTKAATYSGTPVTFGPIGRRLLRKAKSLVVTLDITAAERDSANETYDFYITTGDGVASWDVVHFPQVATTGAKQFTARVELSPGFALSTVTSATPGVAAVDPATLAVQTGGAQAIKSLGAGLVRHGPLGEWLSHELVIAGTVVTGIAYSITAEVS
jgi:hypothetical protein